MSERAQGELTGWRLLISEPDGVHARIVQGMLEAQGIATQLLEMHDSMYPSLGATKLYVWESDWQRARDLLEGSGGVGLDR